LFLYRFVTDKLDDNEGGRSRTVITNYRGIVKFEVNWDQSVSGQVPTTGWVDVNPLNDEVSAQRALVDGDRLRVWVRATDSVGNIKVDNTSIVIDGSPPSLSTFNSTAHEIQLNVADGEFKHSSRYSVISVKIFINYWTLNFAYFVSKTIDDF